MHLMWMCVASENALFSIPVFDSVQLGSHISQVVGKLIRLFITAFISFLFSFFFPPFKQLKTCVKGGLRLLKALLTSLSHLPFSVFTWVTQSLVLVPTDALKEREVFFLLEIVKIKHLLLVYQGLLCEKTLVVFLGMCSNHSHNYHNDDECFQAFFLLVTTEQWQTLGKHCSSGDEFPIHGSLQRGTYTRKGKSTERVTDGDNSLSQKRTLSWNSVWMVRICKPPSGWSRLCVRQTPAWHPLAALTWPVQLLVPWGAQADFSEVLSFDWFRLRLCLWIVRPQKAELIFREELQAKVISRVLYIVQVF